MTNEEMLDVFGDFNPAEYEAEAEERWGDSDAYRRSARRTASYSKADWLDIKGEAAEINAAFAELLGRGTPADSDEAATIVDRHRAHITTWFYDCSPEIHAGLGSMYVDDGRFAAHFEADAEGLARYVSEAIAARYR